MDFLSKTIDSYNSGANWHSKKFDGYNWGPFAEEFVKSLSGKKVLDFGCGNGRDSSFFVSVGLDVVGIDFSEELLKIAKLWHASTFACLDGH